MKFKKMLILLVLLLSITACTRRVEEEEETPVEIVTKAQEGEYQVISPFKPSPLRQIHAISYRDNDVIELGRRILEKSKEHFSIKNYFVSEGQVIDVDRFYDLTIFKSDNNPDGLMTKYETLDIDGVTLQNPIFISDIFEFDFHEFDNPDTVAGLSIALVLKRMQFIDEKTGAMHSLSDDALFNVGQTLGLQLTAYLRSIEGMSDVPIYIGLYAQTSDVDKLPNNYLPGEYIGDGFSKDKSMQFKQNDESWIMLSEPEAAELLPQIESAFYQLKRQVIGFVGDESTALIGKAFVVENKLDSIRLEVNTPARTYLELYGLGHFLAQEIETLGNYDVPIKVDINVLGKTRMTLTKKQGVKAELTVFE